MSQRTRNPTITSMAISGKALICFISVLLPFGFAQDKLPLCGRQERRTKLNPTSSQTDRPGVDWPALRLSPEYGYES